MSELIRVDQTPIVEAGRECRAFMVVRGETLRLPYVLEYHRSLGITRFFVVDNDSSDGSLEYLLQQPDCHVFSAPGSYAAARCGIDWLNHLVARYGNRHWCLNIDADECLVYPDCERVSLPRLCDYLDQTGADGLFSVMLDMYSDKPILDTVYQPGERFLDACPYFDRDYHFRRRTGLRPFPPQEFIGGPRLRCFYPEFTEAGMVGWNLFRLVRSARTKIGVTSSTWGVMPPMLVKIPLIRGGAGKWLTSHRTTRLRLADIRGALLHFKYFSDFHERVITARAEGQHSDDGSEYTRYHAALRRNARLSFCYEGSVLYSGSGDLVRRGFISSCESYKAFAADRVMA